MNTTPRYMVIRSVGTRHMGFPIRYKDGTVPKGYQLLYTAHSSAELQQYAKNYAERSRIH